MTSFRIQIVRHVSTVLNDKDVKELKSRLDSVREINNEILKLKDSFNNFDINFRQKEDKLLASNDFNIKTRNLSLSPSIKDEMDKFRREIIKVPRGVATKLEVEELREIIKVPRGVATKLEVEELRDMIKILPKGGVLKTDIDELRTMVKNVPQNKIVQNEFEKLHTIVKTIPRGDATKVELQDIEKRSNRKLEKLKKELKNIPRGDATKEEIDALKEELKKYDNTKDISELHTIIETIPKAFATKGEIEKLNKTVKKIDKTKDISELHSVLKNLPKAFATKGDVEQLRKELKILEKKKSMKTKMKELKTKLKFTANGNKSVDEEHYQELKQIISQIPFNTVSKKDIQEMRDQLVHTSSKEDLKNLESDLTDNYINKRDFEELYTKIEELEQNHEEKLSKVCNVIDGPCNQSLKNDIDLLSQSTYKSIKNNKNNIEKNSSVIEGIEAELLMVDDYMKELKTDLFKLRVKLDEVSNLPRGDVTKTDLIHLQTEIAQIPRGDVMKSELLRLKMQMFDIPRGDVNKVELSIVKNELDKVKSKINKDLSKIKKAVDKFPDADIVKQDINTLEKEMVESKEFYNTELENKIVLLNSKRDRILNEKFDEMSSNFSSKLSEFKDIKVEVEKLSDTCNEEFVKTINKKIRSIKIMEKKLKNLIELETNYSVLNTKFRTHGNDLSKLTAKLNLLNRRLNKLERR